MNTLTFQPEEIALLKAIVSHFASSSDPDTHNTIEKVRTSSGILELGYLELIGLKSILQAAATMAAVDDNPATDPDMIQKLIEKMK